VNFVILIRHLCGIGGEQKVIAGGYFSFKIQRNKAATTFVLGYYLPVQCTLKVF
jgi:hypothetical protein